MYSMKPYHEFSSEILLPRCMYNLEPICDVKLLQEDAAASAAPIKGDKFEELLQNQNGLLQKLRLLQDDISTQLSQQTTNTNPDVINEIVICMDPSNPSSSILLAQSILSSIHPILISSFTHSSARCLDKVNSRINSSPSAHDRNLFKFGIAYIWKKAPHLPILLLHPSHHIPIMGESNIVKYLFSLIAGRSNDVVKATICDDIIDTIDSFKTTGSPTLESILDTLVSLHKGVGGLKGEGGLLGEEGGFGAVDVLLWSTLKAGNKSSKSIPPSLQGWFEALGRKLAAKN